MKKYDVVVIGGGITGASIARELSRYKLKAALLEKEVELAFGVSKSNSGIVHPGTQNPVNSLKARLCVEGNRLTRKLAKEISLDYKEVGELVVGFNSEDMMKLQALRDDGDKLRVPNLRIIGAEWLKRHEPNLNPLAKYALLAPTAAIVSPYRWVYALEQNARRNGIEVFTSTRVEKINSLSGNGFDFEISTSNGQFRARYVINAAGLYADDISAMVGVNNFKITPRKGEEFLLDKKREYLTNHIIFPLPTAESKGILVIKTSDGNPMIGPTAYNVESKDDLSTSDKGLADVLRAVKRLIPSVDENDIIAYFAGLRPAAGEDFIIRHEGEAPGFVNVAGIQSPGLTSAPAIALMVLDLLKKNGLELRRKLFFHAHRRKTVHLFSIPFSDTKRLIKKDPSYGDIVCRCEMVSAKEVRDAIKDGATTMDGIKFRTRAQAGRCHGSFCTTRIMKILAEERKIDTSDVTKRGKGSELVKDKRG